MPFLTVPGRSTLIAAAALCPLLLLAAVDPWAGAGAALLADGILVAACLLQGRALRRAGVALEAAPWPRLERQRPATLVLRLRNPGQAAVEATVRVDWPPDLGVLAQWRKFTVSVAPGQEAKVGIPCLPVRRGPLQVPPPRLEVTGSGLLARWARVRSRAGDLPPMGVRPNLSQVEAFEKLRHRRSLAQMGVHRVRRVGEGREFEQLREYMPDDEFRQIDWKATARRGEPVTALHQAERAQDVVLCLDCGRMMGAPYGAGTALDAAVDAAIMLAHAVRGGGDKPGLLLFDRQVRRWLAPASSAPAWARIGDELGMAQSAPVFPSYAELAAFLRMNQKRRATVFVFSDLGDPQLAANMAEALPLVSRRHAVVVVGLRDPLLHAVAAGAPAGREGLYQVLAAAALEDERAARIAELTRRGVEVLEADAGKLGVAAVNKYLEAKARGRG